MIGGSAAAEVVLNKEVRRRTAEGVDAKTARAQVAAELDRTHDVDRAHSVGSVDAVIAARELRPAVIAAVEQGTGRSRMVS